MISGLVYRNLYCIYNKRPIFCLVSVSAIIFMYCNNIAKIMTFKLNSIKR